MLKSVVCVMLAAVTFPVAARSNQGQQDLPEIVVRLYNYAGAPEETLSQARQQASRTLLQAGTRLFWLLCTPGLAQDPRCHVARGPSALWLRICPEQMIPNSGLPPGVFGFALMPKKGPAMAAWVYFQRLEKLATRTKLRLGPLLGTMLAHEIGHLLLGANSHAPEGIMSLPWDAATLHKANLGQLEFTADQAATIRAEALRRLARIR